MYLSPFTSAAQFKTCYWILKLNWFKKKYDSTVFQLSKMTRITFNFCKTDYFLLLYFRLKFLYKPCFFLFFKSIKIIWLNQVRINASWCKFRGTFRWTIQKWLLAMIAVLFSTFVYDIFISCTFSDSASERFKISKIMSNI